MQERQKFGIKVLLVLVSLVIGIAARALFWSKASGHNQQEILATPPHPAVEFTSLQALPNPSPAPVRQISQEQILNLPRIGRVRIRAFEPLDDSPDFEFTNLLTGKKQLEEYVSPSYCGGVHENQSRFIIIRNRCLLSPLVISIVMSPGRSDSGWEATAAGVINGELQELTYEHLRTSDEGGFFFGDLGHSIGYGAVQWDFVWGEDEAHVSPHRYEITLYKWNGWRFEWYRVFRTRSKYFSGRAALRANGLHYVDIRKSFPGWSNIDTW